MVTKLQTHLLNPPNVIFDIVRNLDKFSHSSWIKSSSMFLLNNQLMPYLSEPKRAKKTAEFLPLLLVPGKSGRQNLPFFLCKAEHCHFLVRGNLIGLFHVFLDGDASGYEHNVTLLCLTHIWNNFLLSLVVSLGS